jgi:hypothetical protein
MDENSQFIMRSSLKFEKKEHKNTDENNYNDLMFWDNKVIPKNLDFLNDL